MPVPWKSGMREAAFCGLQDSSTAKHYLTILPHDGSTAHVYDVVGWQRLMAVANLPFIQRVG